MFTMTQPAMTMRMLFEANNTLYLVQPLKSVERFAVLFGGLLGALLRDQAYEISKRAGEPVPATLPIIDEAGNTPVRWLPDVASTCSGVGIQLVTARSTTRVRLLPPDLLRQVPPGSALLLRGILPPAHLTGRRSWEERRLRALAAGEGPSPEPAALSEAMQRALASEPRLSSFVVAHMTEPPAHDIVASYDAQPGLPRRHDGPMRSNRSRPAYRSGT